MVLKGVVMTKRGRPRSNEARRHPCMIRLNDEEKEMFFYLSVEMGFPVADMIREAVKFYSENREEND